MANRQTRRNGSKQQLPDLTTPMPQIPPIVIGLDNCRVIVRDIPGSPDAAKELLFAHASGGVIFRALIGQAMQRELATLLSAPPGIIIPDTPPPAA